MKIASLKIRFSPMYILWIGLFLVLRCTSGQQQAGQSAQQDPIQGQQQTQQLAENTANVVAENAAEGGANGNFAGNSENTIAATDLSANINSAPIDDIPLNGANIPLNTAAPLPNIPANTNPIAANSGLNNIPQMPNQALVPPLNQPQSPEPVAAPIQNIPQPLPAPQVNLSGTIEDTPAGSLTWVGYHYKREEKQLNVEVVTRGQPKYRIFQETNRRGQNEFVVRFQNTKMRHRIRRDIDATEFRSPVAYIRVRENPGLRHTDVILTLRDQIEPTLTPGKGGLILGFSIPERWYAPTSDERPVASAEVIMDESAKYNPIPKVDKPAGMDQPTEQAYVPDPGAEILKSGSGTAQPLVPKADSQNELVPAGNQNLLYNDQPPQFYEVHHMVLGVAQANYADDVTGGAIGSELLEDIPLANTPSAQDFQTTATTPEVVGVGVGGAASGSMKKAIRLEFRDAPLSQVIRMIAGESGVNFIISPEAGTKKTSISLKNVPWDVALKAVLESNRLGMQEISPGLVRIDFLKSFSEDRDAEERARQSTEALIPTKVLVMPLSYAKAEDAAKLAQAMLPKVTDSGNVAQKRNFDRFKVQADSRSNSVVVEATPNVLATIKTLLERLDTQTPQVRIASRLVEVTNDVANGLGVQWSSPFSVDPGRGLGFGSLPFPNSLTSVFAIDPGGATEQGGNAAVHFGSLNNMMALDLKLRLYQIKKKAETLQTQDVVVQDNEKAVVTAGTSDFIQTAGGVGATGSLIEVAYNLSLTVTPHITADGAVQMKLDIKGDSAKDAKANAAVSKNTRQLQTTLLKRSGETAVIGGLYSSEVSNLQRGVPILSDIPLIGALFRSTATSDSKKDLLIMVTPTVVGSSSSNATGDATLPPPPMALNSTAATNFAPGNNAPSNTPALSNAQVSQQNGAVSNNSGTQSNSAE